ncbi:Ras-related protein Rab11C [Acorus calamus]|uniref:Ras-related protein Rab11C n=1 Tax=Acorus calamus TaxID=4465 RepID=A0AAV9CT48_ACOCL|nr:Ras-related protein Rab11C [Acorus calamus]
MEDESSTTPRKSKVPFDDSDAKSQPSDDPVYKGPMAKSYPFECLGPLPRAEGVRARPRAHINRKDHHRHVLPRQAARHLHLSVVASTKSERIVWEMEHKVDHEYDYFFKIVLIGDSGV